MCLRSELLYYRSLRECHIIFIGRNNVVWVLLGGLLNHLEQGRLFLFTVDDEGSTENLMTTVLRVNLGETEDLRVGQFPSQVFLHLQQVIHLFPTQGQAFLLIILFQIIYENDRLRLDVHREDILVQPLVHALKHGVIISVLILYWEILLDTYDAFQSHVLGDFYGIGTPWGNHFPTRTDEKSS